MSAWNIRPWWRRFGARREPTDAELVEHTLGWNALVDEALADDEIVATALAEQLRLGELRRELSCEEAATALRDELRALRADGRAAADDHARELAKAALRTHVRDRLERAIERRAERSYALRLPVGDASRLASRVYPLHAKADARIRTLLPDGGSVGIVGPARVGKTSLLRRFCEGSDRAGGAPVLTAVVKGSARADPREFVTDLLVALSKSVDGGYRSAAARGGTFARRANERLTGLLPRVGAMLAWGGLLLVLAGALNPRISPLLVLGAACVVVPVVTSRTSASDRALRVAAAQRLRRAAKALPLVAVGTLLVAVSQVGASIDPLVVIGMIAMATAAVIRGPQIVWRIRRRRATATGCPRALVTTARSLIDAYEHADTVPVQETNARGVSIGKRLVLGASRTLTRARAQPGEPESLAMVIRRLRQFIGEDARDVEIRIWIDLNHMRSGDVRAFVKAIEDVLAIDRERCLILVSARDGPHVEALHGTCRPVIALEPLSLADARRLLDQLGVDLPIAFAALCQVLAAGLPVAFVDQVRTLVESNSSRSDGPLSELARKLVECHLAGRAVALGERAASHRGTATSGFMDWAYAVGTGAMSADALLALRAARSDVAPDGPVGRLADELAGHCYLAATVLAFFDDALTREALEHAVAGERPPLDLLRDAQAILTREPDRAASAVRLVERFREECGIDGDRRTAA